MKTIYILTISCLMSFCLFPANAFAQAQLATALENRNLTLAEQLLKSGVAVNQKQADGMTALHWAVYYDDYNTATQLVSAGADIHTENNYGVKPLSLACLNGNTRLIAHLLEQGADPNTTRPGRETALMTAARTGINSAVKTLIAHGADINATERKGQTALMWAAADGHNEVVQTLLDAGADHQQSLNSGFNAFFFAIREGHIDVTKTLLNAGADVNKVMNDNNDMAPLLLAIENGHFELAAELLKAGADPNDQRTGHTPLHTLSWVRKPDSGDNGDPAPVGSGNLTSLDMVDRLIAHGADVNAQLQDGRYRKGRGNKKGATPFFFAADTADLPLMKRLVKHGADPLIPNADNTTPLLVAAGLCTYAPGEEAGTEEEALEAVKFLLDHGADINHVDNYGETAMHGAVYKSLPRMVHFLADNGADIEIWNQKNKHGWTPLIIANGYRPGNFKPAFDTIKAVEAVMRAAGVEIPSMDNVEKQNNYG